MSPSNPLFAFVIIAISLCIAYLIVIKQKTEVASNRFETIDGLRGFLAISVFVHHSSVWYSYLHTGYWNSPESYLFNQLGQSSVDLFFMISSFLFINKLLQYKGNKFNWKSFFIKRFLRLTPLHFFAVMIILTIVFIESQWKVNTDYVTFAKSVLQWLGFGLFGLEDINLVNTSLINAGVLWSLPYEWLFYFSLPIIAVVIMKTKPSMFYIIIGLCFVFICLQYSSYRLGSILSFVGGAIAPVLLKCRKWDVNINNHWVTFIVLASFIGVFQFHSSNNIICKMLITIAFTLIALGNDIFGLLKVKTLKLLGDISYSTYLLHGIMLYTMINYILGLNEAKLLSPAQYSIVIFTITPLVVLISYTCYRYIELPFIKLGKQISAVNKSD